MIKISGLITRTSSLTCLLLSTALGLLHSTKQSSFKTVVAPPVRNYIIYFPL
ncbi:hypothetical protein Scep_001725 [Stephania cephalantha]|uniref:Uncharacterized protein n=1 Tax=Stephania cephalantha TaxID=152367 RepID=A0AAP0LCE2_9MAGN